MAELNPEFAARVDKIAAALDSLDYFQLLRVSPEATMEQIREGYHAQARQFHPDRFQHMGVEELVKKLTLISKRITEAYVTLRDADKRERYKKAIGAGPRPEGLRYDESLERQAAVEKLGPTAGTGPGRQMLDQALAQKAAGNLKEAVKSLRMALLYEKDNAPLHELLAAFEAELT